MTTGTLELAAAIYGQQEFVSSSPTEFLEKLWAEELKSGAENRKFFRAARRALGWGVRKSILAVMILNFYPANVRMPVANCRMPLNRPEL